MDGWIYFDYWLGKQSLSCYLPHAKNGKRKKKKTALAMNLLVL